MADVLAVVAGFKFNTKKVDFVDSANRAKWDRTESADGRKVTYTAKVGVTDAQVWVTEENGDRQKHTGISAGWKMIVTENGTVELDA